MSGDRYQSNVRERSDLDRRIEIMTALVAASVAGRQVFFTNGAMHSNEAESLVDKARQLADLIIAKANEP